MRAYIEVKFVFYLEDNTKEYINAYLKNEQEIQDFINKQKTFEGKKITKIECLRK